MPLPHNPRRLPVMPLLGPLPAVGQQAFVGGLDALASAARRRVLAGETNVLLAPSEAAATAPRAEGVFVRPLRLPTGEMGAVVRVVNLREHVAPADEPSDDRLESLPLPPPVRAAVARERQRLRELPVGSAEWGVAQDLLRWTSALPWQEPLPKAATLISAAQKLSREHHGLGAVKQRLLEHLALVLHSGKARGEVLLLIGPPGVGKTTLARQMAVALGRPFARLALGGLRDEAEICGHRRTYVGARPGKLVEALANSQSLAPVILLDELDKLEAGPGGCAVAHALLAALDSAQHHSFVDHYLGYGVDLSRVLFLATANDPSLVPAALRDRMELVSLGGYGEADKVAIATKHLLPRLRRELTLTSAQFNVAAPTLKCLIRGYTDEAGVRELERLLASLGRKAVLEVLAHPEEPKVFTGEEQLAALGEERYSADKAPRSGAPGAVQMLACGSCGGMVLSLEVLQAQQGSADNRVTAGARAAPALTVTGHFGRVAQESAQVALTYLLNLAATSQLNPKALQLGGLHLHAPCGDLEKEGASAGLAMLCAFASLAAKTALSPTLAVSGELTLHGLVLPVGGLREKLLAAQRQNLSQIILPKGNARELQSLPRSLLRGLNVHLVETGFEALRLLGLATPELKALPPTPKRPVQPLHLATGAPH